MRKKEKKDKKKEIVDLIRKWIKGDCRKELSREEEYELKKALLRIVEKLREKALPEYHWKTLLREEQKAVLNSQIRVKNRNRARKALEMYYKLLVVLRDKGTQGDRVALWVLREASKFDELAASILEVARIKGYQHYYFCSSRCPRFVRPGTEREPYDIPAWGPTGCPCDGIRQKYYFRWDRVNEKYRESRESSGDPQKELFWGTIREALKELGLSRGIWEISVTRKGPEKCISPWASYAPFFKGDDDDNLGTPGAPDHFSQDIVFYPCSGEVYHSPKHGEDE